MSPQPGSSASVKPTTVAVVTSAGNGLRSARARLARALLALVVCFGVAATVAGAEPPPMSVTDETSSPDSEQTDGTAPPDIEEWVAVAPGPIVIESLEPTSPETVERIEQIDAELVDRPTDPRVELLPGTAAATAGFVTAFDANVPTGVREAVASSVAQWGAALRSNVPVVVQVSWVCLGDAGVLGYAGAGEIYQRPDLPTPYGYPTSLANSLTGIDLNGGAPELRVVLNAELAETNSCSIATGTWHTADTPPPPDRLDMRSVVVHEVAHGLGFLGSAWRDPGAWSPRLADPPYRYDSLVRTPDGPLLTRADPNAYLSGPLSIDVGGGRFFDLHSPGFFKNGSSFSHFAESAVRDGAGGELMVAQLERGTVRRSIDAAVLGILDQQGWVIAPPPVTPAVSGQSGSGQITIDIDPRLDRFGAAPVSFVVAAWRGGQLDASVVVPAGQTGVTLRGLYNSTTYDVSVTPTGRTASGSPATTSIPMPSIPNQPLHVSATGSGSGRTITWTTPLGAAVGDLYRVEQRTIGGAWSLLGETTASAIDTPPLAQGVYQFRVTATRNGVSGPPGSSLLIGIAPGLVRPLPLDGQVGRMFAAYFQRSPDPDGYAYWMRELAIGTRLVAMSAELAASPEFRARYGELDDTEFVELVYRNVLGRAADGPGRSYWVAQLRSGRSRGDVMLGFAESPEHIASTATAPPTSSLEAQISRLYFAFFLREPDPEGLAFWIGVARTGTPLATIAQEMASSAEFVATYGSRTDLRFVELVYNNVLTRSPDSAGQAYWIGQLATTSRGAVMTGFSESLEFILRTGTLR